MTNPIARIEKLTSLFLLGYALAARSFGEEVSILFTKSQPIPNIKIDGQAAHIHTQGLFVDDQHIYVTGRLENAPKRPVFLRFERKDAKHFSVIDLSITDQLFRDAQMDHPGGFDFDGSDFWIPVAKSSPAGPTAIVKVSKKADKPFESWKPNLAFVVDDHIGAIACEPKGTLWGANWDTRQIYSWDTKGTIAERIERDKWNRHDSNWALAVQDWKFANVAPFNSQLLLLVGGLDKSPFRDKTQPRSVIEIYAQDRTRIARIPVPGVEGFRGNMTNEGLCVLNGNTICLLPADIGRDAKLYFFSIIAGADSK